LNTIAKNKASLSYEWVKNLPEDWEFRLIKREFTVTLGKMLQSVQHNETETEEYYLRSANLRWEGVDITDVRKMWFAPQEKKKLALQYGDLLVSEGGDVGRTSSWQNELSNCYIQNAINRVRSRKKDSTRFLYYWLYLIKSIGYIDAIVSRITIAHLTAEKLERIQFVKPPIPVQYRIAAYLDKTCAAIDKAIEAKQKQLEILDALRKSIIHKAITRGLDDSVEFKNSGMEWLGKIPRPWDVRRIKSVADIRYGLGQPPAQKDDGLPMVRATNVSAGKITDKDLIYIDPRELPPGRNPYLKEGEIIVVRSGAYTGDSAIIPKRYVGAVAGYDMVITVTQAEPRFLAYSLLSDYVLNSQILLLTLRAAQPHLNAHELGGVRLSLPETRAEQREICDYLDLKLAESARITATIVAQISTLEQYRKSLIHECVTGKRRITEDYVQDQL